MTITTAQMEVIRTYYTPFVKEMAHQTLDVVVKLRTRIDRLEQERVLLVEGLAEAERNIGELLGCLK